MAGTTDRGGGNGGTGRGAAAAAGGLRAAARRAAALPDALHLRLLGLLPAPLRTDRFARGFYAAAALFAWIAATAGAVVALFAPFATPAQKLGALLFAWTPLALPVWRGAAASVRLARARRLVAGPAGDGGGGGGAAEALARWRPAMLRRGRLACLPVAAAAGWFAVACSTAAVAAVAWQAARDAAGLPGFPGGAGRAWAAALLLLALGGAALVGMGRFFAARLEADPTLPGDSGAPPPTPSLR